MDEYDDSQLKKPSDENERQNTEQHISTTICVFFQDNFRNKTKILS